MSVRIEKARLSENHASESLHPQSGDLPDPPRVSVGDVLMPDVGGRSRYDLRVLQSIRRIIRAVEIHSRQLTARFHITAPQLVCLLVVRDHGPMTATALANHIFLSPSTVVGIIDRLEEKDLVRRRRDSRDRRRIYVAITQAGRDLAANAPSLLQDTLTQELLRLPEDQQAVIAASLEKVVDLMEARGIDAAPLLELGALTSDPANRVK